MNTEKYNGWTNYETWNYALWLDNDQGSQEYWAEEAQEQFNKAEATDTFSRKENAAFELADQLKNDAEEFADDRMKSQSNWLADAVNAYLGEVNWYEISEHFLSDIDEEGENL